MRGAQSLCFPPCQLCLENVLDQFANEVSKLLWQLRSRCPFADRFYQCEALQNAEHFNNRMHPVLPGDNAKDLL